MSQEHRTIRRLYEAFSHRDLAAIAREMHGEAQVDFSRSLGPERGVYHGVKGIETFLNLYWEPFEDVSNEAERFIDGPHGIMALVVARGRGRGSGVDVEARGPHVWTFRDGKPIRFTLFQEEAEALEAVGLRR